MRIRDRPEHAVIARKKWRCDRFPRRSRIGRVPAFAAARLLTSGTGRFNPERRKRWDSNPRPLSQSRCASDAAPFPLTEAAHRSPASQPSLGSLPRDSAYSASADENGLSKSRRQALRYLQHADIGSSPSLSGQQTHIRISEDGENVPTSARCGGDRVPLTDVGCARVDAPLDAEFLELASRDYDAFAELRRRFNRLVWASSYGYGLIATRVVRCWSISVWLKLFQHLGTIRDPTRLAGWLATTTIRRVPAPGAGAAARVSIVGSFDADDDLFADRAAPELDASNDQTRPSARCHRVERPRRRLPAIAAVAHHGTSDVIRADRGHAPRCAGQYWPMAPAVLEKVGDAT